MDGPPPPPPPHGANPKSTAGGGSGGLPPGNYDIFIIPPHSSGGGFIYLPSLNCQWNSFFAGVGATVAAFCVWKAIEPTLKQWVNVATAGVSSGGSSVIVLILIVGVMGWVWGKSTGDGTFGANRPGDGSGPTGGSTHGTGWHRAQSPSNGGFPGATPPPQGSAGAGYQGYGGPPPHSHQHAPPPHNESSWSGPDPSANAGWNKAREETRKREEEKKRAEEAKKRRDEEQKKKEEADRQARAQAEKEKWEKMRVREREQREREARERIAKERLAREKEQREKDAREREAREAEARTKIEKEIREKLAAEQKAKAEEEAKKKAEEEKAAAEAKAAKDKTDKERSERLKAARERAEREREARIKAQAEQLAGGRRSTTYGGVGGGERTDIFAGTRSPPAPSVTSAHSSPIKATVSPKKNYEKPTAKSYLGTEDEHSFRPYDTPKRPPKPPSHASTYSESSYAPSQSTSRTTPPPSQRGPYSTNDPDKIQIKGVYLFTDSFPKPVAQLIAGIGNVTDGLILKITTEGLFIDDDVRGVPQREWDVKAWTMKLLETGERAQKHILRASIRDAEGKKYIFIIDDSESWKVAVGLQRLKRGSQVRSCNTSAIPAAEMARLFTTLGI